MRLKKPRWHVTACKRMERPAAMEPNEVWYTDFVRDEIFDGWRIRLLTIADNFTRESLVIDVNKHIGRQRVVEVLMQLGKERGLPKTIRGDRETMGQSLSAKGWTSGHI